jgi:hypothetical protein
MGTGMQGDAGLTASINKSEFDSTQITNQGSLLLSGGNINLTAKNDIKQQGSGVISGEFTEEGLLGGGDITYNAGGDVTIEAAANTYKERTSSSSENVNIGANTGGTLSIGYGQSSSKSNSSDIWYTNSQTMTGEGAINIKSGNDTIVRGANVQGTDVNINTSGNLTVESLQDEHHSSNSSKGLNVGLGFTGASSGTTQAANGETLNRNTTAAYGISVGYNRSSGESDSAWVNNQTSIVGTNSVGVNADTTHIKGAVIANITGDGKDGGNLEINANKLTYEDIHDYDNSYETGFGIQTNFTIGGKTTYEDSEGNAVTINKKGEVNLAGDTKNPLDSVLHPDGSTTVTVVNKGHEIEQETRATVGEGEIVIDGQEASPEQLEGLNRDIEKAQEITKDQVTGALDYSLTVDHKIAAEVLEFTTEQVIKGGKAAVKAIDSLIEKIFPEPEEAPSPIHSAAQLGKAGRQDSLKKSYKKALLDKKIWETLPEDVKQGILDSQKENKGKVDWDLLPKEVQQEYLKHMGNEVKTRNDKIKALESQLLTETNPAKIRTAQKQIESLQGVISNIYTMMPCETIKYDKYQKAVASARQQVLNSAEYKQIVKDASAGIADKPMVEKFYSQAVATLLAKLEFPTSNTVALDDNMSSKTLGRAQGSKVTLNNNDDKAIKNIGATTSVAFHEGGHLGQNKSPDGLLMPKEVENIGKSVYFDNEKNYSTPTGTTTPVTINTTQYYPNNTIENINTFDEDNKNAFVNKETQIKEDFKSLSPAEQNKYKQERQQQIMQEKISEVMINMNQSNSFTMDKNGRLRKLPVVNIR